MNNPLAVSDFTIDSWGEVAIFVGLITATAGAIGAAITARYTRSKQVLESQSADDAATDRLIRLIEQEAEKRVAIVRAEFELQIAEMKREHAREIAALTAKFESELDQVRRAHRSYYSETTDQQKAEQ